MASGLGAYTGSIDLEPRLLLVDRHNTVLDDVTSQATITEGKVRWDEDAESIATFSAVVADRTWASAYTTFVAPFQRLWFTDSSGTYTSVDEQLGLFVLMPMPEQHSAASGVWALDGRDLTWILARDSFSTTYNIPTGTNIITAIRAIIASAGFTRMSFPNSARTTGKNRSYRSGTRKLTIINELLAAIAWYPLWMDRHGILTSFPIRADAQVEATRTISSANGDVVETVEINPDTSRIFNRVTVIGGSNTDAPIVVTKTNNHPESPVSTVNTGIVIPREPDIEDHDIETTADATTIADKELEVAASVNERLVVRCIPDPRLDLHEPVDLDIIRDDGYVVATGKWRWDEWEFGFTPEDGAMVIRCNKLVPASEVV